MQTHSEKTNSSSVERSEKKQQDATAQQFADNRSEAVMQRKLQDAANNSPQARNIAQLQAMVDDHASTQDFLMQKKENNTGMPDNLKSGIENLSGYSMDEVRVHYNSSSPAQLQAHAYAQGTNIHLGPGQEKHLPHEAWHVVQQKQGRVKPTLQTKGGMNVNDDTGLEKEADVMGSKALQMKSSHSQYQQASAISDVFVFQLISTEEKQWFEVEWEGIEKELDHLYELDHKITLEISDKLEDVRSLLGKAPDKINRDLLRYRIAVVRNWMSTFTPKFDREGLALFKLLGPSNGADFQQNAVLIRGAAQADIYINGMDYPGNLGTLLKPASDFPGAVYHRGGTISITHIVGTGRLKEAESYLKELGLENIRTIDCGSDPNEIVKHKLERAYEYINGKNVSLSIMPLSTLAVANRRKDVEMVWSNRIGGDPDYQFEVVRVKKDQIHFVADIKWANGILVKELLDVLDGWGVTFSSVNLFGIAGSLVPVLGPDTMVVPRGEIHSLDQHHAEPVSIPWNDVFIPGSMLTMDHGNVSSILEENAVGVKKLLDEKQIHVVEMEAYHLVRKLEEMEYTGKLKIVFKIHDVVTSETQNISISPPQNHGTLLAKQERDKLILEAFEILPR